MNNQKGISVVAIVIGVVVGLIIVGIGGFLMLSDNNKQPQQPNNEIGNVIQNIEILGEEKEIIKDEYLGYFAKLALAKEDQMLDEASIMAGIAITRMWQEMEEEYAGNTFNQDALNNLISNNITNSVDNSLNNSLTNQVNTNMVTNTVTDTTTDTSLLPKFPDGTTVISRQADIQKAIFETFGQQLENLSQILEASWSTGSDETYDTMVLKLDDITKANGIYTAIYTVCTASDSDILSGVNIYGLPAYTIEAKFQQNAAPIYSEYQLLSVDVVEEINPIAYHLTYIDGKYGVIDNNGTVILEAKYSKVVIPNSYIGLFACYTEGVETPLMVNERGIQQFKDYDSAALLQATAGTESSWIEPGVVVVSLDGYYGLIDYDENIIFDAEYKSIEPLGYQREKIVLTKEDGTKALATTDGKILSDFAYTKIGILGVDFETSVLVSGTVTQEEVIAMMEKEDYTIGQTAMGTYATLEKVDANAEPVVMSTLAKSYDMQIGTNWQLALLDGVTPVYTRVEVAPQQ